MGNDSSNNNPVSNTNSQPSGLEALIDGAFSHTNSQHITRAEFNQSLKMFEAFNNISICNSHLATRLFEILEPDSKGRIDKNLVADRLKKLLRDPVKANKYSFRLYDADRDNKISRRQFSDFFEKSWVSQTEIVKEKLKAQPSFDGPAFYEWLKEKKQDLLQISGQIFNQIDLNNNSFLSSQEFENWIASGNYDFIVFKFADTAIHFPLHLGAISIN